MTRQFQWNSCSGVAYGSAISNLLSLLKKVQYFFAYFMVTRCINAQARQHRDTIVWKGCLSVSFTWFRALLVIMMNLYWHSLSFTHSQQSCMALQCLPLHLQCHSKLPWNTQENTFSEARGTWKCPWSLPTLLINKYFKQRAVTELLKPGRIPVHMRKKCTKLVSLRA